MTNPIRVALAAFVLLCSFTAQAAASIVCGATQYAGNEGTPIPIDILRSGDLTGTTVAELHAYAFANSVFPAIQVTFAPGETSKTVTVVIEDDLYYGIFKASLLCFQPAKPSDSSYSSLEIYDNEPFPKLSVAPAVSVNETDGWAVIPYSFTPHFGQQSAFSVSATVIAGTATVGELWDGGDLRPYASTISINGSEELALHVDILNDNLREADETFRVKFSGSGFNAETVVTIIDDETATLPFFEAPSYTFDESQSNAVVHVIRPGETSAPVTVGLRLVRGDMLPWPSTTLTIPFAAGEVEKDVQFPINDTWYTGTRTALMILSRDGKDGGTATIAVYDDESKPVLSIEDIGVAEGSGGSREAIFDISLTETSWKPLAISVQTHNGTAQLGSDFGQVNNPIYITPGTKTAVARIPIVTDTEAEEDETFTIELTACCSDFVTFANTIATATILDDDRPASTQYAFETVPGSISESARKLNLRLVRTGDLSKKTSVTVQLTNTAFGQPITFTPASASFAINEVTRDVSISIDDAVYFGNIETRLELLSDRGVEDSRILNIIEDEAVPVISIGDAVATEAPGTNAIAFIVHIDPAYARDVQLEIRTEDRTARLGHDFSSFGTHTVVAGGLRRMTLTTPLINDAEPEPDEQFDLFVSATVPGTSAPQTIEARGTILDDDVHRTLSPETDRIAAGTTLTMTIDRGLASPPAESIVVSSSNPAVLSAPARIDAPAGQRYVTFVVTAAQRGSGIITAHAGNEALSAQIEVYGIHTIVPSPHQLLIPADTRVDLAIELSPTADTEVQVTLRAQNSAIAEVDSTIRIAPGSRAIVSVLGKSVGTTSIELTLPADFGGTTINVPVQVVPAMSKRRGVRH